MTVSRSFRLGLAAMVATACATACLVPLVKGLAWALPVALILVLNAGTGVAMRRLTHLWALVPAAQLTVLVLTVSAVFTSNSALFRVIPTASSVQGWSDLLHTGSTVISTSVPPIPFSRAIMFLIALGMGVVAVIVDLVAVTLERPAVAGLPLLAVYCVPAAVLPHGLSSIYFLIAAAGYLILVAVDHADSVHAWGQTLGLRSHPGDAQSQGSLVNRLSLSGPLSGGRRLAAVALAAAVLIPVVTPGVEEQAITTGKGGAGNGDSQIRLINPILNVRKNLMAQSNTRLITYRTNAPQPEQLRIATLVDFNGQTWAPKTGALLSRKQKVQDGLPNPPGLSNQVQYVDYTSNVAIGDLQETFLPVPYPPTKVTGITGDWLYESDTFNIVGDHVNTRNLNYSATYRSPDVTAAQLSNAPAASSSILADNTALPAGLSPTIHATAVKYAGQGTTYQKVLSLQDWLRSKGGFVYDPTVTKNGQDDSGLDAVQSFLVNKHGYCVQFASTMAVLVRSLGIPARVSVGFLPGTKQADGSYVVTAHDAHAWPEIYFEGIGWMRFEPTPSSRSGAVPGYAQGMAKPSPSPTPSAAGASAARPSPSAGLSTKAAAKPAQAASAQTTSTPWWKRLPWGWILGVVLLALLALIPRVASALDRRRRWRAAVTGPAIAEAGWDDLRRRLNDLGVRWVSAWTPRAAQHRLIQDYQLGEAPAQALARLSQAVEGAWYAPPQGASMTASSVSRVRSDSDLVVASVADQVTTGARRMARFLPRSGWAVLTGAERRSQTEQDFAQNVDGELADVRAGESRETVQTGSGRRRS